MQVFRGFEGAGALFFKFLKILVCPPEKYF